MGFLFLSLHSSNFGCSHIPCYYFRLLRLTPRARYRIEVVGKLVCGRGRGGIRDAPCGLRPCKERSPLEICCRERPVSRSAPFVGYIAANGFYSTERYTLCVISNQTNASGTMFAPQNVCVESFEGVQRGDGCLQPSVAKRCFPSKVPFGASPRPPHPLGRMTIFAARG